MDFHHRKDAEDVRMLRHLGSIVMCIVGFHGQHHRCTDPSLRSTMQCLKYQQYILDHISTYASTYLY